MYSTASDLESCQCASSGWRWYCAWWGRTSEVEQGDDFVSPVEHPSHVAALWRWQRGSLAPSRIPSAVFGHTFFVDREPSFLESQCIGYLRHIHQDPYVPAIHPSIVQKKRSFSSLQTLLPSTPAAGIADGELWSAAQQLVPLSRLLMLMRNGLPTFSCVTDNDDDV